MQKKCKENAKKTGSQWVLGWVLSGFSVGPQRVLSEYSGYSWVLRLCIFEYSGGSQVGTPLGQPLVLLKHTCCWSKTRPGH